MPSHLKVTRNCLAFKILFLISFKSFIPKEDFLLWVKNKFYGLVPSLLSSQRRKAGLWDRLTSVCMSKCLCTNLKSKEGKRETLAAPQTHHACPYLLVLPPAVPFSLEPWLPSDIMASSPPSPRSFAQRIWSQVGPLCTTLLKMATTTIPPQPPRPPKSTLCSSSLLPFLHRTFYHDICFVIMVISIVSMNVTLNYHSNVRKQVNSSEYVFCGSPDKSG